LGSGSAAHFRALDIEPRKCRLANVNVRGRLGKRAGISTTVALSTISLLGLTTLAAAVFLGILGREEQRAASYALVLIALPAQLDQIRLPLGLVGDAVVPGPSPSRSSGRLGGRFLGSYLRVRRSSTIPSRLSRSTTLQCTLSLM